MNAGGANDKVMGTFKTDIRIDAPISDVWEVLADVGTIHRWNPGVVSSHLTTAEATGVGAGRHCDLGGRNYVDEEVVAWEAGQRLTMRIIGTNLPFKAGDVRFSLRPDDNATIVTVSPEYALKFGLFGKILDLLYVRRAYLKGMEALLAGLKAHVERRN